MAYSMGSAPVPPPPTPGGFSHAYDLHQDATSRTAQQGVAPVNQMNQGFGGRAGNPNAPVPPPPVSGGNRTSQHVATPGNNNVSYGSMGLSSPQSLWQQGQHAGAPAPVNGMSMGFIKNTQAWSNQPAAPVAPTAPVTPPPPPAAPETPSTQLAAAIASGTAYVPPKGGVGSVAAGEPAPSPFQNKLQADQAWDRNHMGAKFYTVDGQLRRTSEYAAFLRKHGFA